MPIKLKQIMLENIIKVVDYKFESRLIINIKQITESWNADGGINQSLSL